MVINFTEQTGFVDKIVSMQLHFDVGDWPSGNAAACQRHLYRVVINWPRVVGSNPSSPAILYICASTIAEWRLDSVFLLAQPKQTCTAAKDQRDSNIHKHTRILARVGKLVAT